MKRVFSSSWFKWTLTIAITLGSAVYQRMTGPTYPVSGTVEFEHTRISYELLRSHGGAGDQPVELTVPDTSISAALVYRRYPTSDPWTEVPMLREGDKLTSYIPHQPPAGKVEYYIKLQKGLSSLTIPPDRSTVTRFKGAVPTAVLLPHVLFMFLAMLFSTRTGLEALSTEAKLNKLPLITLLLLTAGGMILGPIVQKFAFGAYWTGIPFGWDLTDNKTLIAFVAWIIAWWQNRGTRRSRSWALAAAFVTLIVFLIPHSVLGSELKYE